MVIKYPMPQTFAYKTDPSGHQIFCDVYVPEDAPKPYPVIMWIHYSALVFENRHAVGTHMFYSGPKRGYIVVNLDHRLAPQAKMHEIYGDVEDCATWVRQILPKNLGGNVVDTSRLILGGGSCGAQLALTAGLYMNPPPQAIISLYALVDPTDPEFTTATSPNPPPGRTNLIPYSEVEEYLDSRAASVSHPEKGLNIPQFTYHGRPSAFFYMIQEGIYLRSVYGAMSPQEIHAKWAIPNNITAKFPPTFVSHALNDRFVSFQQSEKLVASLKQQNIPHTWYIVSGDHDHGFDVWDMEHGEEGEFEKAFAAKLWPWLDMTVRHGDRAL